MIRINLIPVEELESPYWYGPDLAALLVCMVCAWFGIQYYTGLVKDQITTSAQERDNFSRSSAQLQGDLARFKDLDTNITSLRRKLEALQKITTSKLARVKSLIVLEHLQNLKPDGVWFNDITIDTNENLATVKGASQNHLLVAEFLTSLEATKTQDSMDTDLRTQIYFPKSVLESSTIGKVNSFGEQAEPAKFSLNLSFGERLPPTETDVKLSKAEKKI